MKRGGRTARISCEVIWPCESTPVAPMSRKARGRRAGKSIGLESEMVVGGVSASSSEVVDQGGLRRTGGSSAAGTGVSPSNKERNIHL